MNSKRLFDNVWIRNGLGLLALVVVHLLADYYAIGHRAGWAKVTPYLYLTLLYGWLVFHNRVLFEGLFLRGRKSAYFGWVLVLVAFSSFNMNYILNTQFGISQTLPYIVSFWVYTVTGLGVYITYTYLRSLNQGSPSQPPVEPTLIDDAGVLSCMVDGVRQDIPYSDIRYIESLENYLKLFTWSKTYVIRLTLKEAETRLPKRQFVRISRSHIVNATYVVRVDQESVKVGEQALRIGKVFKRQAMESLGGL